MDISGLSTEEQQNLFKILQVPVPEEERFPLSDHGNECVEHCPNRPPENYSPVQVGLSKRHVYISASASPTKTLLSDFILTFYNLLL